MSKTALLLEMIELIRARPGVAVDELSSSLGRSQRTIYRWLSELCGDIGAAVYCDKGGYYLSEQPDSLDRRLTAEELLALRTALRSISGSELSPLHASMESAWNKIRDSSSGRALDISKELAGCYDIRFTVTQGLIDPGIPRTVENAIGRRVQLKIIYRSQKSNTIKEYVINPYAMVFRRHSWYLLAYSHEHRKVAQFKLIRFKGAACTQTPFIMPDDFSVSDYFKYSWEAWAGGEPTTVRVKFSPQVAEMVSEAIRHHTQVVHPQPDGGVIFEATVSGIEEIANWIMGFGKEAEALEPARLRDYIRNHASGMVQVYDSESRLVESQTITVSLPNRLQASMPETVEPRMPEEV